MPVASPLIEIRRARLVAERTAHELVDAPLHLAARHLLGQTGRAVEQRDDDARAEEEQASRTISEPP